MYTSVMLIALSSCVAPGTLGKESPVWLDDYRTAYWQGKEQRKPLAVFFASGGKGWDKVSSEGNLGDDSRKLLRANYVCVYLDTTKDAGRHWASTFGMSEASGIVVIDRSGQHQAFRHAGTLTAPTLEGYLRKYADPDVVVRTTETVSAEPVRYVESMAPGNGYRTTTPIYRSGSVGRSC